MKTVVIMPGGFHPFHPGHLSLYHAAQQAFPQADVYVAATNDTSERPFPFKVKEKLAQLAGVEPGHFVQVKSPFRADEITQKYDPNNTVLVFVRSEKDRNKPPVPGGTKKDGTPAKLQPLTDNPAPMSEHVYMTYLPTQEFVGGMIGATQIREKWPTLNDRRKTALVMSLYPKTQGNLKLAQTVVKMLDTAIGQDLDEAVLINNPETGIELRPDGGLGTWNEESLSSSLVKQLEEVINWIKVKNYTSPEYVLYKAGAVQSKLHALAQLEKFRDKQGRRPIGRGREIDIGETQDYAEEKFSR